MLADIDQRLGAGAGYSVGKLYMTTPDDICLVAELPGSLRISIRTDLTHAEVPDLQALSKPSLKLKAVPHVREPLRQQHGRELGHNTLVQCKLQMQATTVKEIAKLYGFSFTASAEQVLGFIVQPYPMTLRLEPVNATAYHLQLI